MWLCVTLALFGPTVLCAPLIAILYGDLFVRNRHGDELSAAIDQTRAQIADLQDLQRTRSYVLARKQIVEAIESTAREDAEALVVAADFPAGVQLQSLQAHASTLELTIAPASASSERALLAFLGEHGWRGLRVAQAEGNDSAPIRIQARWPRESDR